MGNQVQVSASQLDAINLSQLLTSQLQKLFESFDLDGNGSIEMSEIKERFKAVPAEGQVVLKVFSSIDFDGSGEVDKTEFISFFKVLKQQGKTEEELQHFIEMINKKVYVAQQHEQRQQLQQR